MIRIILALCLIVPATAFAFSNEPAGFRTLSWGDPVTKIVGIRPVGKPAEGVTRYIRMDETFMSEGIMINDVQYVAYEGKLVETVTLFDCARYATLKDLLVKKYGNADKGGKKGDALTWTGIKTTMTLAPPPKNVKVESNQEPPLCSLTYSSSAYLKKSSSSRKK